MLTQTRSRCYYMDGSLLQNFKKRIVWSLHFSNERLPDKYDNLPKQTVKSIYNGIIFCYDSQCDRLINYSSYNNNTAIYYCKNILQIYCNDLFMKLQHIFVADDNSLLGKAL